MSKRIIFLGYIFIMCFSFCSNVYAEENENAVNFGNNAGWVYDSGKTYYYENGELVHGFKNIDGKTYFFGITKGFLLTGWQSINGNKFYLYEDGTVKQGFNYIDGKTYYVENNYLVHGFKSIGDKRYFFGITQGVMLTGWQSINRNKFYLYEDGTVKQGFNYINGKTYYVENDYLVHGFKSIGDKRYFFGMTQGVMLTGWQSINGNKFYLYEDGTVKQGFNYINGKTYYVENDYLVHGFKIIGDKRYFFGMTQGVMLTGWQSINGNKFYLYEDGTVKQGFNTIDGKKYYVINDYIAFGFITTDNGLVYANEDGLISDGWKKIDGKTYYVRNDYVLRGFNDIDGKTYFFGITKGMLLTGWQSIDGKKFYLYEDGTVKQGFNTIDGKKYYVENNYIIHGFKIIENDEIYADKDGIVLKEGFQIIDGKTYYINNYYILKNGFKLINEKLTYIDQNGIINQGFNTVDGKKYYIENNYIVFGFKNINGFRYFFSDETGELLTGWQNRNGKLFYLYEDGTVKQGFNIIDGQTYYVENDYLVHGFKEIDGKIYFFGITKGMLLTGWQNLGNDYFYLYEDGTVKQGFNVIDGQTYYVENNFILKNQFKKLSDGIIYTNNLGVIPIGFVDVGGKKYYLENNYLVHGFKKIEGKVYYFGQTSGATLKGWQHIDFDYFYCTDDGSLMIGNQIINDRNYYFRDDGILDGFRKIDDKVYYYDPDGTMVTGNQTIADRVIKFDGNGVFITFVTRQYNVIDVSRHQGIIDWNAVKASGLVDAVILRIGYAQTLDDKFLYNISELNRLGIPYSVYLFSYAENGYEAGLEANFVVNAIKNNNVHISPLFGSIFYDLEDWTNSLDGHNSYGISKNSYSEMITTFASIIKNDLGLQTSVYASLSYIYDRFNPDVYSYARWIAQWGSECTYNGMYDGWQYTSKGSVPGISGNVDMSYFYY